jgi:hypothetical protein
VVTSSGNRRSTSRANDSAQRRVARRLRPALEADLLQHLTHDGGDPLPVREGRARLRVDVDPELVGMLDVGPPRGPGVEVDRAEIRRPGDLRHLGDAELVGMPSRREGDARRLDPFRSLLRHALLVDRLSFGSVRVALELRGALVERSHDPVGDTEVVADVVELRLSPHRVEDLVRVRDPYEALPDRELDERRRHAGTLDDRSAIDRARRRRPVAAR